MCAVGGIWILKNDKMPTNHSVGPYYEILLGREDDGLNYSKILFHKVIIDVHKLILDFSTSIDNGTKIVRAKGSIHGKQNSNRSLEISHLDSQRICVTKETFQENNLVQQEYIELNIFGLNGYRLRNGLLDLDFYIHQKGQLLRKLRNPNYHLDRHHIKQLQEKHKDNGNTDIKQEIKLKVAYVDVLRRRADSINPCDVELQNEDNKIRHSIIDAVGCIPAFTSLFLNESLLLNESSKYPSCSKTEYRRIFELYGNFLQTKNWYTQPCTKMSTIVTMADPVIETSGVASDLLFTGSKQGFRIEFTLEYLTESYRETITKLAFNMATLWSQVGGFIGMFLGYSLLQLPELAENLWRLTKSFFFSR